MREPLVILPIERNLMTKRTLSLIEKQSTFKIHTELLQQLSFFVGYDP